MPTAKAAANIQYDILNKEDGAARDSNQNRLSRGPSDGVHFIAPLRRVVCGSRGAAWWQKRRAGLLSAAWRQVLFQLRRSVSPDPIESIVDAELNHLDAAVTGAESITSQHWETYGNDK